MRYVHRLLPVFLLSAMPLPAMGKTVPENFTLGRLVSPDYWMYMHFVHNPEAEWIENQWGKVWDAFLESGIDKDVLSIIMSAIDEKDRAEIDAKIKCACDTFGKVQWNKLIEREFVFAERIEAPVPSYMMMARGAEGSGAANAEAIAGILDYIVKQTGSESIIQVTPSERQGVKIWTVSFGPNARKAGNEQVSKDVNGSKSAKSPYQVHIVQQSDIVGLLILESGEEAIHAVLTRMAGKAETPSLVETERFKSTIGKLPAPEDGVMYFDYSMLFRGLENLMSTAFQHAQDNTEAAAWKNVVHLILSQIAVLDNGAVTMETHERQQRVHSFSSVREDKQAFPIARIFLDRKPIEQFDKYIPADTTSFSVSSFIDVPLLHDSILGFFESTIPDGKEHVAKYKGFLASVGFDPQRDIFSWWGGELIYVDMPAAVPSMMGNTDTVMMIGVRDTPIAREKINQVLTMIQTQMTANNQQILITPNPEGMEGFWQVTYAPMAMFLRPVIGVTDGWLMIGTSTQGVNKCLQVAAGKEPSILKNKRFMKEGIVPKGAIHTASFTDTSNFGNELGQAIGMASMVGGMISAGMAGANPNDPEAAKAKQIVQKIFGIIMKLGPVVQKIDFLSSESKVVRIEGLNVIGEQVTTYKKDDTSSKNASAN